MIYNTSIMTTKQIGVDTKSEKQDSFEAEAMGILQGIKDDTVREMLLKQMKALV